MDLLYEPGLCVADPQAIETVQAIGQHIGLKRKEQYAALNCLLANLFVHRDKTIGVPRSRNSMLPTRYNPRRIGAASLISALNGLTKVGLTNQNIGTASDDPSRRSLTTISATGDLLLRFSTDDWSTESCSREKPEIIRLKDSNRVLTDYIDTDFTHTARRNLQDYIKLINKSDVWLDSPDEYVEYDGSQIRRTFLNGCFWQGGRLVGPWCHLSKRDRNFLFINENPTSEIDFPSSHVNVLYMLETGQPYDRFRDAYNVEVGGLPVDRSTVKKLVTIALNSSSPKGFANAVSRNVGTGLKPMQILRAFLEKHSTIAQHYLQGFEHGNLVQFYESELMMNIIRAFTKINIPVLTIYDSVIIENQHLDKLEEAMFSGDFFPSVEELPSPTLRESNLSAEAI